MNPTASASIRLFQAGGITVFLHWSWFLVAAYELSGSAGRYQSRVWNVAEYLALFVIVLLHEFGHALACRQVGGIANQIVLWPFGGVAYVNPPQRPGAMLWSIAAGPLVNVVLLIVLVPLGLAGRALGLGEQAADFQMWFRSLMIINFGLLVFNLLPIYPLDGGQILRSLLWFVVGRAQSLVVASIIGLLGVALLIGLALLLESIWVGMISAFILMNCWRSLQAARMMLKLEQLPRHVGFACPHCSAAPQRGAFWVCDQCHMPVDTFETLGTCPNCAAPFSQTRCLTCGAVSPWQSFNRSPVSAMTGDKPPAAKPLAQQQTT